MRSYDIPKHVSDLISAGLKDLYDGSDSPSWTVIGLQPPLLTVWAVEKVQGVTDNGGFQYFFENDWPDNPPYLLFIDALRAIGADEASDCLQDAVECFPFEDPHLDYIQRREFLESLRQADPDGESVIDKLGDRVIDIGGETFIALVDYIMKNLKWFPKAKLIAEQIAAADRD